MNKLPILLLIFVLAGSFRSGWGEAVGNLDFNPPTPANNSYVNHNWTEVNQSITSNNISSFIFNWNGTEQPCPGYIKGACTYINTFAQDCLIRSSLFRASPRQALYKCLPASSRVKMAVSCTDEVSNGSSSTKEGVLLFIFHIVVCIVLVMNLS